MEQREVPDAELVVALAQGDLAALRPLYDLHSHAQLGDDSVVIGQFLTPANQAHSARFSKDTS
jgi:hypothetical protein